MTNKEIKKYLNDKIDLALVAPDELWDSDFQGYVFRLPPPLATVYRIFIGNYRRYDFIHITTRLEGFRKRVEAIGSRQAVKRFNTHRIDAGVKS